MKQEAEEEAKEAMEAEAIEAEAMQAEEEEEEEEEEFVFLLDADSINEEGKVGLPSWKGYLPEGYTKIVVKADEETAKKIKKLNLNDNPVEKIEGLEKLVALKIVRMKDIDFVPPCIEVLPSVKAVLLNLLEISELSSWLFAIPTLKSINAKKCGNLQSLDFGSQPSASLTTLTLGECGVESLPDDFFAHWLETAILYGNKGKDTFRLS